MAEGGTRLKIDDHVVVNDDHSGYTKTNNNLNDEYECEFDEKLAAHDMPFDRFELTQKVMRALNKNQQSK